MLPVLHEHHKATNLLHCADLPLHTVALCTWACSQYICEGVACCATHDLFAAGGNTKPTWVSSSVRSVLWYAACPGGTCVHNYGLSAIYTHCICVST